MSIVTSSILYDGTVSASGGTATGVIPKGDTNNARTVILDDSSEFIDQTRIEFSIQEPKVQTSAPNGYTQGRSFVKVKSPLALDNGNMTMNVGEIRISADHEWTAAERLTQRSLLAQLLIDPDFADFWDKQSLA